MSTTTNVYIGYYAVVVPTSDQYPTGTYTQKRSCSNHPEHRTTSGKFCSTCGSEVTIDHVQGTSRIGFAYHFFNELDPTKLQILSGGHATVADLDAIKHSLAIFPEFLPRPPAVNWRQEIIMAPGYTTLSNVDRCDSREVGMNACLPPTDEWVDTIIKVLGATECVIKYGAVIEVR